MADRATRQSCAASAMPIMTIAASCDISAWRPRSAILRAMGCAVDDHAPRWRPVASSRSSGARLLPTIAAAAAARAPASTSISPRANSARRSSGRSNLEERSKREAPFPAPIARRPGVARSKARGSPAGASSCRSSSRPGTMSSRSGSAHGPAEPLPADLRAGEMLSSRRRSPAVAGCGGRRPALHRALAARTGASGISDLKALICWLAPHGAGFIGLNPLHALAPADPERASPYSASNRHFLNVLYIAVPQVPELDYAHSAHAQERCNDPRFRRACADLRARSSRRLRTASRSSSSRSCAAVRDFASAISNRPANEAGATERSSRPAALLCNCTRVSTHSTGTFG